MKTLPIHTKPKNTSPLVKISRWIINFQFPRTQRLKTNQTLSSASLEKLLIFNGNYVDATALSLFLLVKTDSYPIGVD